VGGIVMSFVLFQALRHDAKTWLSLAFAAIGAIVMPVWPVVMECGAECSYPVPEETSSTFLMLAGLLPSVMALIVFDTLLDSADCSTWRPPNILLVVLAATMGVVVFLFQGQNKRMQNETARASPSEWR